MHFNRDSAIYMITFVTTLLAFVLTQFDALEAGFGVPAVWETRISFGSGLLAAISGYLRMSPLNLSQDAKDRIAVGGKDALVALLAVGLLVTAACAKAGPVLVATDAGVHSSLLKVKAGIDVMCSATKPVLTVDTCKELYSGLTPALEAGQAFNRAAREQKFEGLGDLAVKLGRLIEAVKPLPANLRSGLEVDLRLALGFAAQ